MIASSLGHGQRPRFVLDWQPPLRSQPVTKRLETRNGRWAKCVGPGSSQVRMEDRVRPASYRGKPTVRLRRMVISSDHRYSVCAAWQRGNLVLGRSTAPSPLRGSYTELSSSFCKARGFPVGQKKDRSCLAVPYQEASIMARDWQFSWPDYLELTPRSFAHGHGRGVSRPARMAGHLMNGTSVTNLKIVE